MKALQLPVFFAGAVLALALPSSRSHSQSAPLPTDPAAALQILQAADDDLIKRQESTLKDLTDMTDDAREAKIFSKRS